MFYDERINAEQGRAYRTATIFALVIITLYGILNGINLGMPFLTFISFEAICAFGGACIVAYGELRYGIRPTDERKDFQKKRYYSKAFFGFLYLIIAVYCCIRVPLYIVLGSFAIHNIFPNHIMILLALSTWPVLLFCFKRNDVYINSSFLAVSRKDYWLRVLKHIGKLGGITAIFTAISAIITFMLSRNEENFTIVLLAGLATFISFSVEYIIFSFAERSSDKAKENGKISAATLIFATIWISSLLISTVLSTLTILGNDAINSAAVVKKLLSVQQYFGYIVFYFVVLFAIYLYSEIKALKSKNIQKAATMFITVHIISFCTSQLQQIISATIAKLIDKVEVVAINAYNLAFEIFSSVVLAFDVIALILLIKFLIERKIASKIAFTYPAALIILKIINLILSSQYRLTEFNMYIKLFGTLFLYGITFIFLIIWRKKVEGLILESAKEAE